MLSSGSTIGAGSMQGGNSYSNERTPAGSSSSCMDVDYSNDPASGGFFHADYKKHDDLKQMLDSNKDNLKLEAMKRIIGMIAKGRDASDLFPAVVKNVVSKNIEVKKLVYVYLVRYAEEQQDLALLSISTFQRALKDPNQLIRASALRVLSSIRVSMIVPIVMLAIRDSASDMSPYVRKTVAHAIPKLYNLDPEQKEELITIIEKLLSDRTTLVVGSAVMAFEEVCPERVDLIHKNYRKLCNLLVDIDEWGQVIIINMLTRYARTQFTNPNIDEVDDYTGLANKPFYENTSESDDNNEDDDSKTVTKKTTYSIDLDHRLLLRQTRPLLQSRNASVVMSVAQLYHHVAPKNEVIIVAKALIRLLRSHKEVQSVVLTCIASMSTQRKAIFEPYMKSFFVRTSDPTHIKLLKLEILTNLATETSIPIILREFQTYITNHDKKFVAATIQAIGRCAASIKEVTDTCLTGLVHLLSNKDEYVVAESVVVIKKLLQTQSAEHKDIISQMAKLLDFISVPAARASILWLIGEYNERVPKIAPDVLRKLAKTFVDEENIVKLQVLNLSVKLFLINPEQTELLCQYIFNLARYDQNYDIRDRVRFLKQFILPANINNNNNNNGTEQGTNHNNNIRKTILSIKAKEIFLALKPAPLLESRYYSRENFQLGSLSHYLNMRTTGYHDLPDFPETIPDPTLRNVEINQEYQSTEDDSQSNMQSQQFKKNQQNDNKKSNASKKDKINSFYSDSDKSSSEYNSTTSSSSASDDDEDEEADNGGNDSETETNEKNNDEIRVKKLKKNKHVKDESNFFVLVDNNEAVANATEDSEEDSDSSSNSSSNSGTSSGSCGWSGGPKSSHSNSESDTNTNENNDTSLSTENSSKKLPKPAPKSETIKEKSNLDILLDLDYMPCPSDSIMTPTLGGFLTPIQTTGDDSKTKLVGSNELELVGPSYVPNEAQEMLNKVNGYGLSIDYRYTRLPNLLSSKMVSIELIITNQHNNKEIKNLEITCKSSTSHENLITFDKIEVINVKEVVKRIIGIDFNDSSQQINFQIKTNLGVNNFILNVPVGELIRSCVINEMEFNRERNKLRGMTEHTMTLKNVKDEKLNNIKLIIFKIANVACIPSSNNNVINFVGQTMNSKCIVLLTINLNKNFTDGDAANVTNVQLIINCEKMVIGSMLLNEIKQALQN